MFSGKALLIFNPNSGQTKNRPGLPAQLRRFVEERHLDAQVVPTTGPGDATRIAQDAVSAGYTMVVAVGGDGTVNEVGRAVVNTEVALGVIPLGSGNGFARDLGIPLKTQAALRNLFEGTTRVIDSGSMNGDPYFCAMGMGFDAAVVQRFNQYPQRGLSSYARATLALWSSYEPELYQIQVGTQRFEKRAFLLAVTNASQYGNDAFIAPRARLDDGLLDLVAVPPKSLFTALPLGWRLFRGNLDESAEVFFQQAPTYVIERRAPGPIHLDGELHEAPARMEVSVRKNSLQVRVPLR